MVRFGKTGMKPSVARKKVQKLPPNMLIEVYVSRLKLDEGTLEVCLNREEALEKGSLTSKIPASSLTVGEVLTGIVKNVTAYGVFVDVKANRKGLIHISKVAKQQGSYVSKEDGLKKLGLGKGSLVNVVVLSNDRKRLELDLAPAPVLHEGPAVEDSDDSNDTLDSSSSATSYDLMDEDAAAWAAYGADGSGTEESNIGDDEAAMWAAYSVDSSINDVDDHGDEDDEYDEDTDIEDAFGIGYY
jgi:predicted RNA-binding protein with RPS1 domain